MKVDKRAKFCIFFIIAILALGLSNFAAAFTGDFVSSSFPGINDTDKMIALDDDNFAPTSVNAYYEPKKEVVETNETDNSTDTNSTTDNNDGGTDNNNQNDNSDNQNSNSDSNNNENSGDDSDSKQKPSHKEDSSDDA